MHHVAPNSDALFLAAAERGANLGALTSALLKLLDSYDAAALDGAIAEALERGTPHAHAVRQVLERRRQEASLPPALTVPLSSKPKIDDIAVRPHDLANYDNLEPETHDTDD